MTSKCYAVIQARMLSTRLRGKSLLSVAGVPLLSWVVSRAKKNPFVDEVIVATSTDITDDPLALYAESLGVKVFRGSKEDVLGRFVGALASAQDNDIALRYTADNPMYDARRTKELYDTFVASKADYMHVDGLSHMVPEIVRVGCLRSVAPKATEQADREHVTIYLRRAAHDFKVQALPANFAGLRPEYDTVFTIDRADQLETFEGIIRAMASGGNPVDTELDDCYAWLDKKARRERLPGQKRMILAGREVGDGCPCFVIAEIGQNHNGQVNLGKRLIDMAARCGADAVKFQKREISWELTEEAYNKPYEGHNSFGRTYGEHREYLELNEQQHRELKEYANSQGMIYFCTPCDPPSVDMLERIGNPIYKVASRDITNIPLLRHIAKTNKPVILSTGMAGLKEIEEALAAFEGSGCVVSLMQCVSQYPAEPENINLRAMKTMRDKFDVLVALSDHTPGIITAVGGAVLGAYAIEKHITLSRAMPGTDHAAALEDEGLRRTVTYIRTIESALGDGKKEFNPVAQAAKEKLARSLVSANNIAAGTVLTEDMLILKSPGTGLSWNQKDLILGKRAKRDIRSQSTLAQEDFE